MNSLVQKINHDYVPVIASNHSFVPYDKDIFTLCIDDEVQSVKLNVSAFTKILIEQVDGERTIVEVTNRFNQRCNTHFSVNEIIQIFEQQLMGYGILQGDNTEKIQVKDDYLRLRIPIFSASLVRKITPLFTPLYNKGFFVVSFFLMFLFLSSNFLFFLNIGELYNDANASILGWFIVVSYASLIFHEFGHAAACDRFGAKSGAIGFGFYLLSPVFYSDVTDAWRLSRDERLIIDMAGIYIQMLICVPLVFAFYYTGNINWIYFAFAIFLSVIVNVYPFLRLDGYWALSDYFRISNLRDKAAFATNTFFGFLAGKNKKTTYLKENKWLVAYGLTRVLAIIGFLGYIVIFRHDMIIYWPINAYNFIRTLIFSFATVDFTMLKTAFIEVLIPGAMYFMVGKEFIKWVKKKYAHA